MLEIRGLNKYFNRHRANEIHVIDNTTLSIGKTGLISLLGPSGSGKTTLLNVIGGLDKVNSGQVYINGAKITGRRSGKIDDIRNKSVGYIFQNYNLVDDMTVFDNIALVLKMIGIKDQKEVRRRVYFVLKKVGMYRYRNRFTDMLSGGERQRVGIARALVKNPDIIIADEPTGNLDSSNTIEIMNIIKSISKEKLVILVTHEEKLAKFYSSRIIRLRDGKIVSDEENDNVENLDYRMENKIYLKEIDNHGIVEGENTNINIYSEKDQNLDLNIVVKNGNIYIENKGKDARVEIVDNYSSIELIDDYYKEIEKDSEENNFDLSQLGDSKKAKYHSIFNVFSLMKNGFTKVRDYPKLKKVLLLGFAVSAMFIVYAFSNIVGVTTIKDKDFLTVNKNYVSVTDKTITVSDMQQYQNTDGVLYALPGNSKVGMSIPYDMYYQSTNAQDPLNGSLASPELISKDDLIYGEMPTKSNEIVVDKMILSPLTKQGIAKSVGIDNVKLFIGKVANIPNMKDFKIVGISDLESPSIYMDESQFVNAIANASLDSDGNQEPLKYTDYKLVKSDLTLKSGSFPTGKYETIVPYADRLTMPLNKTLKTDKINKQELKVVGYYEDLYNRNVKYVNNQMVKYELFDKMKNVTVATKDKDKVIEEMASINVNSTDLYEKEYNDQKDSFKFLVSATLILAGIILAISFIEIYLIMRASFLGRIKEVGTYRAIGVKKKDIYKMFLGEVIAITTLSSVPGIILMSFAMRKLASITMLQSMYAFNAQIVIASIVAVYVLNIVFGLLPVFTTLRKTPAGILSRTDAD